MSETHVYTSAKGEDFLSFDQWLRVTLQENYETFAVDVPYPSEEMTRLYNDWLVAEQINSHKTFENNVEMSSRTIS